MTPIRIRFRYLGFTAVAALLALVAATPSGAAIGQWDRIRFNRPVALPGVVLPAGTYVFEISNPESSRPVVRVSHRDTRLVYFTGFTERVVRPANFSSDQVVTFGEAPAGGAQPISAWYPTGWLQGHRFIYRE